MDLNQLTIKQIHQGLKNKDFLVQDLIKSCWKTIKVKEKDLNALITQLEKQSLDQAKKTDHQIKSQGITKELEGIPIIIKDNILLKDVFCTAGSKILKNYQAPYNATVINKLKQAGAIILAKSNLDEFAMGSSGETSFFGPTKNPQDLTRVPGGSSSGSAVSVAANYCPISLGSDTGGSIRQPAAFCGVLGIKPTYGRVSRSGLIAMSSSLDQIGPLARSIDDLARALRVIEGKDDLDSTSTELKFRTELPKRKDLSNLKIGIPKEYFVSGIDPEIKEKIEQLAVDLENQGAKIIELSLPHTQSALACYYIIMPAEVSANSARYDGIRYGYSDLKTKKLLETYLNSRTNGFGEEVKRRIMLGTYVLSAGYHDAYYLQAQKIRNLIKKDFDKAFEQVDYLLTPVTPTTAFKLGEKTKNPLQMYLSDIYTVPVNLAGLPALSIPIGEINGLPVGAQLIGNYFAENKLLETGKIIEELY